MKFIWLAFSLISTLSWGKTIDSSCQFQAREYCATINFDADINRKKDASFELELFNAQGKRFFPKVDPEIKLWMVMKSGHAHGSEPLKLKQIIQKDGVKKYRVSNVWFLMLGQWQILIDFKENGESVNFAIPVCLRRGDGESGLGKCQ